MLKGDGSSGLFERVCCRRTCGRVGGGCSRCRRVVRVVERVAQRGLTLCSGGGRLSGGLWMLGLEGLGEGRGRKRGIQEGGSSRRL